MNPNPQVGLNRTQVDNIEGYHKNHYLISTITYMGSYMITDSIWKSVVISLAIGASKELIYDRLLDKGEPCRVI